MLFVEINLGQDASGNPVSPITTETEWFGCNLNVVTKEYKVSIAGQAQQAKYTIILEKSFLRPYTFSLNVIKNIALKDSNNNELGTFQVQNMEFLKLTNSIKIVV
jgi:hypothetical protein